MFHNNYVIQNDDDKQSTLYKYRYDILFLDIICTIIISMFIVMFYSYFVTHCIFFNYFKINDIRINNMTELCMVYSKNITYRNYFCDNGECNWECNYIALVVVTLYGILISIKDYMSTISPKLYKKIYNSYCVVLRREHGTRLDFNTLCDYIRFICYIISINIICFVSYNIIYNDTTKNGMFTWKKMVWLFFITVSFFLRYFTMVFLCNGIICFMLFLNFYCKLFLCRKQLITKKYFMKMS